MRRFCAWSRPAGTPRPPAAPNGQHTTVVVHLDVEQRAAALHLGPLLSEAERRYLTCDATAEVWLQRNGQLIGAGRTTRLISRRLRRALEHRQRTCAVPGCGATRGLHAHHLRHWEDGGPTELANLVLLCPYHHRSHHRGVITITGPADALTVTDTDGRVLRPRIAGAPTHPTPTRRRALPRTHRRTRPLVVVPTLPTPTTTNTQLTRLPEPATTGTASKPKHIGAQPGHPPHRGHPKPQPTPHRHRPHRRRHRGAELPRPQRRRRIRAKSAVSVSFGRAVLPMRWSRGAGTARVPSTTGCGCG